MSNPYCTDENLKALNKEFHKRCKTVEKDVGWVLIMDGRHFFNWRDHCHHELLWRGNKVVSRVSPNHFHAKIC